jgi:hypothetical protein
MKVGVIFMSLFLANGLAKAGDVSCQAELLKPKFKAPLIEEEEHKAGSLTVAEARIRLQQSRQEIAAVESPKAAATEEPEVAAEEEPEVTDEAAKKESRVGGFFDILLPSKLRNPVR